MKFSYKLLKKLVPEIKNKADLVEKLNLHSFEAADLAGDVIDIILPPNRYCDAAGHIGIAKEISAIYGRNLRIKNLEFRIKNLGIAEAAFKISIQDKNLCPRYIGWYFENIKIAASPKWMREILKTCGMRPINNVVDIMNYAMLETGQPLHAFDFDKISILGTSDVPNIDRNKSNFRTSDVQKVKKIIVRRAKKGEKITTLDNEKKVLNENILVIADEKESLAIAGIKGGKKAEVDKNTKRIIVEAANFDATNIYKSSKTLNLITDASIRFSRGLSPELAAIGINRAGELLKKIVRAKAGAVIDIYSKKQPRKIIKFDVERFKNFIGLDLNIKTITNYLTLLGFVITQNSKLPAAEQARYGAGKTQNSFLVEVPKIRLDIETFEDLAEEIVRLYGYNNLKSTPPRVHLHPSGFEDQIVLKDKIRKVLAGLGLSEVYNYSFISEKDLESNRHWEEKVVEIENPISAEFRYLRPSLSSGLAKNIASNSRFFDEIGIFEIGKFFQCLKKPPSIKERLALGIALASKDKNRFFELKGLLAELFKRTGLVDYFISETDKKDWVKFFTKSHIKNNEILKIESNGRVFGYLGNLAEPVNPFGKLRVDAEQSRSINKLNVSLAEIDLNTLLTLIIEEHEYKPLPKYPSVMRDISILISPTAKVGDIMQTIQEIDLKYIDDVDLIDEFDREGKRSLTFRIVFQAEDRTLTDSEVNKEMNKITAVLKRRFKAEVR